MQTISVTQIEAGEGFWRFLVRVNEDNGQTEHKVTVAQSYWQKLTDEKIPAEELVKKSFEFLLAREPKESILGEFDLSVIQKYFPEYENYILKQT